MNLDALSGCMLVAAAFVGAASDLASAAVLDINQPNRTNGLYFDSGTGASRIAVGQSFVPSYPLLTQIDINLQGPLNIPELPNLNPDINSTTFTVTVYAAGGNPNTDGPLGASLGSKSVDYNNLLDQGDPDSFDAFVFDTPISVTANSKYFFQVTFADTSTSSARAFLVGQSTTNPYASGVNTVLEGGVFQYHDGSDARDLQFRTYGDVVPEPASLGILAGSLLVSLKRRRM